MFILYICNYIAPAPLDFRLCDDPAKLLELDLEPVTYQKYITEVIIHDQIECSLILF